MKIQIYLNDDIYYELQEYIERELNTDFTFNDMDHYETYKKWFAKNHVVYYETNSIFNSDAPEYVNRNSNRRGKCFFGRLSFSGEKRLLGFILKYKGTDLDFLIRHIEEEYYGIHQS